MSKTDPKPGRWILPIVIAALVGFTYVFVNALPPAEITTTIETTLPEITTTTTTLPETTTTTTLPTNILALLQELDRFENLANDIQTKLDDANEKWENNEISYKETDASFTEIYEEAQSLANQVASTSVPDEFVSAWPDTLAASQDLIEQMEIIVEGLHAPDDGSARREAIPGYAEKTRAFNDWLDEVRGLTP